MNSTQIDNIKILKNSNNNKPKMQNKNPTQINPIAPRANSKLVTIGPHKYLIGGMTADKVTSDIYQMRTLEQDGNLKVQWKLLKFKNNVFKPRNSFSACASYNKKIYIWGGLESKEVQQICLSDLIQVDLEKGQMRLMPLKQQIKIHSASLIYDEAENMLLGIGGTNQMSTMESFLYSMKLDLFGQQKSYEWVKARLRCQQHKGHLWQHTTHLSTKSYFTGQPGRFLTTIGGCQYPQSPYPIIAQLSLDTLKLTNKAMLKYGLVSHDSIASGDRIVIFGGATGGDFNNIKRKTILLKRPQRSRLRSLRR